MDRKPDLQRDAPSAQASDVHDTMALPGARAPSGAQARDRMSASPVEIGDIVNGKYRIEGVIGEGGVGVVVSAQHLELDERVALKFLKADALGDAGLVGRFAREAKAAVSIKSEHVARILDVGTLGKNGSPFIVMEYLDGADLRTALQLYGKFSVSDTAEYALHVCEALAMAHANGIIHRDIKPDNLFLTTNPQMPGMKSVKVLDFGISKAALTGSVFRQSMPLVTTQHLMGTPLYMSPEQIRATAEADARSDIWSLGMVMYEMLTGMTAFQGASLTELCAAILERTVEPLVDQRPEIPPELAATIERCLAKSADDRFQNVAELAQAILPFAPKRARSCAERAVSVLRACGIARSNSAIKSTMPPASELALRAAEDLRIPKLGFVVTTDARAATDHASTLDSPRAAAPSARARLTQPVVIAAALLVALAVGVSARQYSSPAPSHTVTARDTTLPVSPTPSTLAPAATAPAVEHSIERASASTAVQPPIATAPVPGSPAPGAAVLPAPRAAAPATAVPATRGSMPAAKPRSGAARPATGATDSDPDIGY